MTLAPSQTITTMPRPSDVAHLFAPRRPSIADEYAQRREEQPFGADEDFECCRASYEDAEWDSYGLYTNYWSDEYDFADAPDVRCEKHGYVYERDERFLYPEDDCGYGCGRLPEMSCPYHGDSYDIHFWTNYGEYTSEHLYQAMEYERQGKEEAAEYRRDDSEAEHDFVETHHRLTPRDIELDREDDRHYRAGRRQAVNRLPRIKRRDCTENQRGRDSDEFYRVQCLKRKYDCPQDDLTWWFAPVYI